MQITTQISPGSRYSASQPKDQSYSVHSDHQGSVRAITDGAGSIVNEYSYDSYGNAETAVETLAQPFRYTGREYDADTGLYYYRARHYDPTTARFLQEDLIGFAAMHPKQGELLGGEFPEEENKLGQGIAVVHASELNLYRYVSNMDDYLPKPVSPEKLVEKVDVWMRKKNTKAA